MNEQFKSTIKNYLDTRASEDELFAKSYAKENKSLNECCQYILSEARKLGNEVCVSDEVVFGWAVHYYDEDNIKVNKMANVGVRVATNQPELTEEQKQQMLVEAQAEYKQRMIEKLIAEEKAKEHARVKERKEKAKQIEESQMSIFDVL